MGRPRTFEVSSVVEASKELFWSRGYEGTALSDIEASTGLNRSSLYQAFGTKEALFEAALDDYVRTFIGPLFAPMESPTARPQAVQGFFLTLAARFRGDREVALKGCLWINVIAEFSNRPEEPDARAAVYRLRLSNAFNNALSSGGQLRGKARTLARRRSNMLVATTVGLWLTARVDPLEASVLSDSVVAELRSWSRFTS
jgi:TetR/AcrR family transcriptional regulator, transcriptional repressor for nem operon